jgi:xylose isomerase
MLLEWPEHSKKLIEGVNSLHTNFAAFHDVTLSAEGKQIKAHRVILAAASTYFKVSHKRFHEFMSLGIFS